jgi:hypothetical protein
VGINNNDDAGGAAGGPDELFGVWNLDVRTPFGEQTATLTLARDEGGAPAGDIKSQLGDAPLAAIELPGGGNIEADISLNLQGRDFAARLTAEVSGNSITGKIKVRDMPIAPALKFTGTKQ